MSRSSWEAARRILCVRLDALGDVLMTAPALSALKEQFPKRHLTLLASPAGAEAATLLPCVDEIVSYEAPWMKSTPPGRHGTLDLEMADRLRREEFDAAVIFTVYSQSPLPAALLLHLAGIPLRLAFCRENPYHLLTDWARESEPEEGVRHEVRRHLELVKRVGATGEEERIEVEPRPAARDRVARMLERLGLAHVREWLVVHPGASAPSRRYPAGRFAETIRLLARQHGLTPVLTGSKDEAELTASISRSAGVETIDLSGRLDLHELTALLERAPLLLANNTGPVHLAAGTGTPVVDLYALTNPQHTPWQVPARVLYRDVPCRFCYRSICPEGHHACLATVDPGEVAEAVAQLLDETRFVQDRPPPVNLAAGAGNGRL